MSVPVSANFTPSPQTAYARQFIELSDGQQWFINEVERMLNLHERTLDTISSRADLEHIVSFGLRDQGISGTLPRAFGELFNLRQIFLAENNLSGPIPAEIFTLSNLENLDLSNNNLSGIISPNISNLTELRVLLLWNNNLSGTIPSQMGNMINLVNLDLAENNLTGQVPTSLGNLTNLHILALSNNPFDTEIPTSFGNLSSLRVLLMWNAGVRGTIPSELGNATNLQILDVADNSLVGGFPVSFENLVNLEKLTARNNQLNIALPSELSNMSSLEIFDFPNNFIPGEIPATFGQFESLRYFIASNNRLIGTLPPQLGNLNYIEIFDVARNSLTGTIPQTFENLTTLVFFNVAHNQLTDRIPDIWTNLTNLQVINLADNKFINDIPLSLANLRNRADIDVSSNYLAGANVSLIDKNDDNFVVGQENLQNRMFMPEYLQIHRQFEPTEQNPYPPDNSVDIYVFFSKVNASDGTLRNKAKLPIYRYELEILSERNLEELIELGIETPELLTVEEQWSDIIRITRDGTGFFVTLLQEVPYTQAIELRLFIIGNDGEYSYVIFRVGTEALPEPPPPPRPPPGGGGGGFSGGGVAAPNIPRVHISYISGYPDGTVRPDANISREEAAAIISRIMDLTNFGEPAGASVDFIDFDGSRWSADYVRRVANAGIIQGFPDGTFQHTESLTRAEFAAIISRFNRLSLELGYEPFGDVGAHWSAAYVSRVARARFMQGYPDGTFRPSAQITRAEVITTINRMLGRHPYRYDELLNANNPFSDITHAHWAFEQVLEATITHEYEIVGGREVWRRVIGE